MLRKNIQQCSITKIREEGRMIELQLNHLLKENILKVQKVRNMINSEFKYDVICVRQFQLCFSMQTQSLPEC